MTWFLEIALLSDISYSCAAFSGSLVQFNRLSILPRYTYCTSLYKLASENVFSEEKKENP